MSNKAQVIFTFELESRTKTQNSEGVNIFDCIKASTEVHGLNKDGEDGPQDLYAHILMQNSPEIIRFLSKEFQRTAKACGLNMHIHSAGAKAGSTNIH